MIASPGTLKRVLTYGSRTERTVALDTANLTRLKTRSVDITDSEATTSWLFERYKPATARTYISAIINLYRATGRVDDPGFKHYKRALKTTHDMTDAQYAANPLTERQQENWMTWEELLALRTELEHAAENDTSVVAMERHLLLAMFTMLPPRRNEYGSVRFDVDTKRRPRTGNFYRLGEDGDTIVLNDYKTSRQHGRDIIPVPPALSAIVRKGLDRFPRAFLFQRGEEAAGNKHVNALFNSMVPGKSIGSALIRKIARTTWEDLGLPQGHRLARRMGHSIATANTYYNASRTRVADASYDAPLGFTV